MMLVNVELSVVSSLWLSLSPIFKLCSQQQLVLTEACPVFPCTDSLSSYLIVLYMLLKHIQDVVVC
jgi:hypothetical protein